MNILIISSTLITKILVDSVLPVENTTLLTMFVLGYLSFYVFRNIVSFLKNYLFSKHGYDILYTMRSDILSSIIAKFSFSSFSEEKQGYILTLFRDWVNSISWFLSNILLNTITECILLLLGAILLAVIHPKIFLITLFTLPIYALVYLGFNTKIRETRTDMMDKDVQVFHHLKESLDSIKEIRVFSTEEVFIDRYNLTQKEFNEKGLKYAILTAVYDSLANITSILGQIIVLYFGALEVFRGTMTLGTLLALNSIVALLYNPIERIVNFNRLIQVFRVELSELAAFMKNNFPALDVREQRDYLASNTEKSSTTLLELSGVSFSYSDLNVLENIHLKIEKGCSYAFIDENGSGKSTLLNLITGLLAPNSGNIFYNGVNIHEDIGQYRRQVGYAPQETFFLNDSIRNNITFGRNNDMDVELEELISLCEVDNFMKTNALDLDTIIGEKGNKLSGGQKQKIALCRALYMNPKILICDEGTVNVDSDSEQRIISKIQARFPELAVIFVSHRLSTISAVDTIFVFKNGTIVEQGNPNQLNATGSEFQKIFANQLQIS